MRMRMMRGDQEMKKCVIIMVMMVVVVVTRVMGEGGAEKFKLVVGGGGGAEKFKLQGGVVVAEKLRGGISSTTSIAGTSSCGTSFFAALVQLIPCRGAVGAFTPIPPSEACCNALRSLGQPCLCVLVNGPPLSGVDRNLAMLLPDKCSLSFDPCEIMKK